jgi:putative Mn2+ efflux pump MntP
LLAFLIFSVTMGLLIFLMAFLGAASGPALAVPLRLWGRRVQVVSGVIITLVGAALVYSASNPGLLKSLLFS